jgi:L-alanine-DL-glutamate epimerase-like enolase superfamily enzyme
MPRIAHLSVATLRFDYAEGRGYNTPRGRATAGVVCLVEVTLDNGLVGTGPVYSHPDLVRMIVERHFQPFLVGKDPDDIDAHGRLMYGLSKWYGRRGVALSALGGVDNALWDLRGKLQDKTVSELLGAARDRIPAYASDLVWEHDLATLTRQAREFVADGFRFVKMRTGLNLDYDQAAYEAVADGVAGRAQILVDAASRYTLADAKAMADFLADRGAYLLEEPLQPDDIDGYAELAGHARLPIAAGEHETSFTGFRELLRAGCIQVAQPDVARAGGVTECLRIARLAQEHEASIITHTWSDAATVIANAQLVTAIPNGLMVEVNRTNSPLIHELLAHPMTLDDEGRLRLPDAPGLGIVLADGARERFEIDPGRPTPDGHYSDLTFGGEYDWTWDDYPTPRLIERPDLRG